MGILRNLFLFVMLCSTGLLMTSCAEQTQQQAQPDYNTIKSMVIDILQTEEAKNAVTQMLSDDKIKQELALDAETVRTTLIQSMSKPGNPHIKEAFQDPKFASTLAKSLREETKQLMKDLMKDPEYQALMMDLMKDPEFERQMMELMKSSAYRKQTMQIMKESLQSPMFQEDMLKLMNKATEEWMKPSKKEKGNQGEEQGRTSGGSAEGGGRGSGGSK
ncbi:spore germination lipoprotein GerD [Brevibacillus marinus]|jgi:spore germination protein D|uniref:spore germination lipoprotein GerD n=1 Tax=Brevibacillus marinus TaxID=2496837 RepID=UPI001F49FF04|nr:spore germination lipoprotein GerD [Brevibacillus marinus]